MKPADRAAVLSRLNDDMDAEGAAHELALLLRLDQEAVELIQWCIEEAFEAGRWEEKNEQEARCIEEDEDAA
jgi:hypothetical protein